MNNSNNVNNASLLERIRELSFVKTELELYLDTHPDCRTAIDYYMQTVAALDTLMEQYSHEHGPLFASESMDTESWSWVRGAWPWQHGAMAKNGEGRK